MQSRTQRSPPFEIWEVLQVDRVKKHPDLDGLKFRPDQQSKACLECHSRFILQIGQKNTYHLLKPQEKQRAPLSQ